MSSKKKIVILAPQFVPQKNGGGPTVSVYNITLSLVNLCDLYIITNNHEVHSRKPILPFDGNWEKTASGNVYYLAHDDNKSKKIYDLLTELSPDIIYQNSFFSYEYAIPAFKYAKKNKKTRLIISPRGELNNNALHMKYMKKLAYIDYIKLSGYVNNAEFHLTADIEVEDVKKVFNVKDEKIYNIPNLTLFNDAPFADVEKNPGMLKAVYIARIHPKKNILTAIESLKNVTGDVTFDIYGPIEDAEYWKLCLDKIAELPENIKVEHKGVLNASEVKTAFSGYHIFFMPTLSENYGHSIVEALMSYKPVIISDQTPWHDFEEFEGAGFAFSPNDTASYTKAVQKYTDCNKEEFDRYCKNARVYIECRLDTKAIVEKYVDMFLKD